MTWKLLADKKISPLTQAEIMSREAANQLIDTYKGSPSLVRSKSNQFSFESVPLDPMEWIRLYEAITSVILDANVNNYGFKLQGISSLYYLEVDQNGFLDWSMDLMENSRETNKLTIYLPLNDDYEGGDFLIMDPKPRVIPPKVGELLLFPSFILSTQLPTDAGRKRMVVGTVTGLPFT